MYINVSDPVNDEREDVMWSDGTSGMLSEGKDVCGVASLCACSEHGHGQLITCVMLH